MNVADTIRPWIAALRGIVAAAGLALIVLGAVLLSWPRPGGIIAVAVGAALLSLAAYVHFRVTRELDKKLRLGP